MKKFLEEDDYVDLSDIMVSRETSQAVLHCKTNEEKVVALFHFVRDEVTHVYDIDAVDIPAKASEVVKSRVGSDDSKAVLFAAMVRSCNIPAGFCYQYLCVGEDDSLGHYMHCYNAVFLDGKWIFLDVSGNKAGLKSGFCKIKPELSFNPRECYGEYNVKGIFAKPNPRSMYVLENADDISDLIAGLPDKLDIEPDIVDY